MILTKKTYFQITIPYLEVAHLHGEPESIDLTQHQVREPLYVHHRHPPLFGFLKFHAARSAIEDEDVGSVKIKSKRFFFSIPIQIDTGNACRQICNRRGRLKCSQNQIRKIHVFFSLPIEIVTKKACHQVCN